MFRRWSRPGPWSIFDDVMRDAFGTTTDPRAFVPDYDVRTDDAEMHVEIDVPGMKEADFVVEVREGVLTIEGTRPYKEGKDGEQVFLGRRYGSFTQAIAIPEGFDADRLEATLAEGVLTIVVPRRRQERRKIPVLSGNDRKRLGGGSK